MEKVKDHYGTDFCTQGSLELGFDDVARRRVRELK